MRQEEKIALNCSLLCVASTFVLRSLSSLGSLPVLIQFGIGASIGLLILLSVALYNRRRIGGSLASGRAPEFMIRPLQALIHLSILALSVVGTATLFALLADKTITQFSTLFLVGPILVAPLAVHTSSYLNPAS